MFLYLSNKSRQRFCGVCFFWFFFWMPPCPCLSVVTGTVICKINCQEKCLHVNPFLGQPAIFLLAWQPASHKQETRLPCLPFLKAWHNLWKLINWKSMAIRLRRVEAVSLFELTHTGAWKNKSWPKAAEIAAKQALSKRDTTEITEINAKLEQALLPCTHIFWVSAPPFGVYTSQLRFPLGNLVVTKACLGSCTISILTVSKDHGLSPFWTLFQHRKSTGMRPAERGCPGWTERFLHSQKPKFTRREALRLKTCGFHRGKTRQIKDDIWHWEMCHYCKLTNRSTQTWGSWPVERHVTILNRDQQSGD